MILTRSGVRQFCLLSSRQGSGAQVFLGLPEDPLARTLVECVNMKEDNRDKSLSGARISSVLRLI